VTRKERRRGRIIPALIACFYAGGAAGWWLHATIAREPAAIVERTGPVGTAGGGRTVAVTDRVRVLPDTTLEPTAERGEEPTRSIIESEPAAELRGRRLRVPVDGADVALIKGGFAERRGSGARGHEAVDILAPRNTPVHAADAGTIAKLFHSKAGGTTIYQFDPSGRFSYYYAHLERYADGLREGQPIAKGDVIGYVGTSGNAPPGTPHLHFAIFELTAERQWWNGRPIDPYLAFR
jgi:murein DD-endopeptidase MepM/ murein hydrolase activator NlpD